LAMDVLEAPGTPLPPAAWWAAGGVGALASAAWPPIFPPLVLAVPGALIGLQLPIAMRPWLGAVAGALAGGALGALVREWVAALAAGGIGAAALLGGAIGLLAKRPIAVELGGHPMVLLAAWSVFAVSGAAFHAGRAWPSEGAKGRGDPASPQSSGGPSSSKSGISSFR
ncbi:MAG TPA: hypothetical protein VLT47_02560, partial [Anaeromyxobacteraceae bacterium]|nr:hypothetical protein [Anaeromyxobacteraceae bacterium]